MPWAWLVHFVIQIRMRRNADWKWVCLHWTRKTFVGPLNFFGPNAWERNRNGGGVDYRETNVCVAHVNKSTVQCLLFTLQNFFNYFECTLITGVCLLKCILHALISGNWSLLVANFFLSIYRCYKNSKSSEKNCHAENSIWKTRTRNEIFRESGKERENAIIKTSIFSV